jgi:hypothetical protein
MRLQRTPFRVVVGCSAQTIRWVEGQGQSSSSSVRPSAILGCSHHFLSRSLVGPSRLRRRRRRRRPFPNRTMDERARSVHVDCMDSLHVPLQCPFLIEVFGSLRCASTSSPDSLPNMIPLMCGSTQVVRGYNTHRAEQLLNLRAR